VKALAEGTLANNSSHDFGVKDVIRPIVSPRRFMRKPIQMTVREYFSHAEDIHAMMSKFPADGGLNPVLVEAERLNIYEQHLPKRWQDNLYALGYDPMGSTLVEFIEQAGRQETIDA
jgi:hypothetical protein